LSDNEIDSLLPIVFNSYLKEVVQKGVVFPFLNNLEAMSVVATSFKRLGVSGFIGDNSLAPVDEQRESHLFSPQDA
jgi:hypothetical protein